MKKRIIMTFTDQVLVFDGQHFHHWMNAKVQIQNDTVSIFVKDSNDHNEKVISWNLAAAYDDVDATEFRGHNAPMPESMYGLSTAEDFFAQAIKLIKVINKANENSEEAGDPATTN